MKNFKKLFASLAVIAMVATAVPTAVLGSANYSDELEGAYDYAYTIGITTQPTIDTADMYGSLIRSHMAKMMSEYAKEVLNRTPDTSMTCEFTDVANQSEELRGYITEACQLGLMGVGITAFNPNGVVTRAQFGTVLSRALYGDEYNVDTTPYYAEHLAALKDAGIMTMISNPNQLEVRGYVMLMMKRAAGDVTPAICNTPENLLACSLGLDTCPAECQTVVAKEGTLTLSSIGVDYTSIPGTGDIVFGSIKLDSAGADISVNSIKINLQGLVSVNDLGAGSRVYFEKDGVRISSKTSFNSADKTALVTFTTPLVVKSSETIDVVLSLYGASLTDIQLKSTDVNASAQTVNGSFVSPSLRTTTYAVASVTAGTGTDYTPKTVKVDPTSLITLWGLKVTKSNSTDRAVILKAVTLNNLWSASVSDLEDLGLYRDNVKVSTKTTVGSRTVSFVLNNEIKGTENNIEYVIKGKVVNADRITDYYDLYVRNTTDVIVNEKDTAFRAIMAGTPKVAYATIEWGDLRFNENSIASMTVTPGAKKVQFYSGSITTLQAVRLDTLQNLSISLPAGTTNLNQVLDNLYLQIGNSIISASTLDCTGTQKVNFEWEVSVNGTVPFIIYGDIKTDYTTGGSLQFTDPVSDSSFLEAKYSSDDTDAGSIWSIGGRRATISTSNLTLTNSASAANIQRGDRNIEIAKLEYNTNSDIIITLTSFALTVDAVQNFKDAQVTLYNEAGTALASSVIRSTGTNVTLDSFVLSSPITISKGNPVKFTVKLDQVPNSVEAGDILSGYVKTGSMIAKDFVSSNYVYPTIDTNTTVLTVVSAGTPDVVTQMYTPSLVKYGSTSVELGNIDLKSTNGDVTMRDAYFVLTGATTTEMNQINSLKLLENDQEIATLLKDGNLMYVTNINKVLTSTPKTYKVVANINDINNASSAITGANIKLQMVANSGAASTTTFESAYGSTWVNYANVNGYKDMSSTIRFVNEVPTIITDIDTYRKDNDIVCKVTFNSTKLVELNNIKFSVNQTNLSGYTSADTEVYIAGSDINYTNSIYGSGTTIASGTAGIALSQVVNVNWSNTVYVILKDLANKYQPVSYSASRQVGLTLTDVSYNDVFETGKVTNNLMLSNYQAAMAGLSSLSDTATW